MKAWKLIVGLVLAVALALAIGYVVGVAHTVRVMCAAEQTAKAATREAEVPISGMVCDHCREIWPDWFCWLGGCP